MFVEVEVEALALAEVAEVLVVFEVVADRELRGDVGAVKVGGKGCVAFLIAGGIGGEGLAGGEGALAKSGGHAANRAFGIVGIGISVGSVNGVAVVDPGEDGGVAAVEVFGVAIGGWVVVDAVAELVAKGGGIGVVVIVRAGLVGVGGIESDAFVHEGIAVPNVIAVHSGGGVGGVILGGGSVVRKGVAAVEHRDAVDEDADATESGQGFGGGRSAGVARDLVNDGLVGRVVGEEVCLSGVEIPRAHEVGAEASGAKINRGGVVADCVDPGVGGEGLNAGAA